jgi:hypothetical protein
VLLAIYFYEYFIKKEYITKTTMAFLQSTSVNRTEFYTPGANCFAANDNTAVSEQVFNISVTKIETIINPNRAESFSRRRESGGDTSMRWYDG